MNAILQVIGTLPFSFFYFKLNKELQEKQSKKIAMNSTSLFHAISAVLAGLKYIITNSGSLLIQMNTGGYLLFDLYYIIMDGKYDLLRFMYIYHHIALYPYLMLSNGKHYWPYVVFFAELSNIPNYLVYYSLKRDQKKKLWDGYKSKTTKDLLKYQLYIYSFFRVFVLGYYMHLELKGGGKKPIPVYMTSIVYFFGLIWFGAMIKQNLK
jgi:hypothetical protein